MVVSDLPQTPHFIFELAQDRLVFLEVRSTRNNLSGILAKEDVASNSVHPAETTSAEL